MTTGPATILIVEDEAGMRSTLAANLEYQGYRTITCENGKEGLACIQKDHPDVVISDLRLPDGSGLQLLEGLKEINPEAAFILITGHASLETALEALNEGAFAYVTKPFGMDEVYTVVRNALKQQRLMLENQKLIESLQQSNRRLADEINERKSAEQAQRALEVKALAQSKLATLGQVAAGLAHEINQPLTYISTINQVILEGINLKDLDVGRAAERLEESNKQIGRITKIVQHLRTFGRADETEMTPVDLQTILDDTLLLLGERLRLNNILLERQTEKGLSSVIGSSSQLEQVFINFFQNSIDSLSEYTFEKRITVRIRNSLDHSSVLIEFSDNGPGIPPEHLDRLFEPFFTTKLVGQGTGLGLSIVYGIIQEHGGTITCASEQGLETTFVVTLPAEINKNGQ